MNNYLEETWATREKRNKQKIKLEKIKNIAESIAFCLLLVSMMFIGAFIG